MLKNPIHRASLLAIVLFALLISITWKSEKKASDELADLTWPVELELRADLGKLAQRHELVQDTLSWHAGKLAAVFPELKTAWRYQFCCDGALSASLDEQVLRGKLSLELPDDKMRFALMRELARLGYVGMNSSIRQGEWTCGSLDLTLPVPDGSQTLVLTDVGFGLRTPAGRASNNHHS